MTNQLQIVYAYSISGKPLKQLTHLLLKYHIMISRTVHELSALTNKPKKQTHTQTDTDTTEHNAYHLATLSLSCVLAKMFHDTTLQQ